jgi:hypothetical protein
MPLRSNVDADIITGFNYDAEIKDMPDGRVRARATLAGKTFEAFDTDMRWAN